MTTTIKDNERIHETVRERYADAALQVLEQQDDVAVGCCGPSASESACCEPSPAETEEGFGAQLYSAIELDAIPSAASLASLGCGNPVAVAELHEGETVLDLGSRGGLDVLLSAKRVGETGYAYGLDMTDEMLKLARTNAAEDQHTPEQRADPGDYAGCLAGAPSVSEFREGLEAAGPTDVVVEPTIAVADEMHSAIIRATKPA